MATSGGGSSSGGGGDSQQPQPQQTQQQQQPIASTAKTMTTTPTASASTSTSSSTSTTTAPTPTPSSTAAPTANGASIIYALGSAFASPTTGEPMSTEKIAQILTANMPQLKQLVDQGKLNHQQILQLKEYADKSRASAVAQHQHQHQQHQHQQHQHQQHQQQQGGAAAADKPRTQVAAQGGGASAVLLAAQKAGGSAGGSGSGNTTAAAAAAAAALTQASTSSAFRVADGPLPILSATSGVGYPISHTLGTTDPGPVAWAPALHVRPTLTGGVVGGRMSGTPAQVRATDDANVSSLDEARPRRKNTPGDQSMRRTIQDLVSSIDPSVKMESDVEDLLLAIADEFIDSVTNFGCRLAKHRGGDTLEVKDLQLHLERNHNIRIPGFASDETRLSLSQSTVAPAAAPTAPAATKKGVPGSHMTLRSHRLQLVQQAKRDAKLI